MYYNKAKIYNNKRTGGTYYLKRFLVVQNLKFLY